MNNPTRIGIRELLSDLEGVGMSLTDGTVPMKPTLSMGRMHAHSPNVFLTLSDETTIVRMCAVVLTTKAPNAAAHFSAEQRLLLTTPADYVLAFNDFFKRKYAGAGMALNQAFRALCAACPDAYGVVVV